MGDIGKRAGMHEGRGAFQGLHQVGLDGVLHQDGQRAGHAQVFSGDGFALAVGADHHRAQALAHIGQAGGQGQDGHDLAGDGDIKAGAAGAAFFFRAQARSRSRAGSGRWYPPRAAR